MEDKIPGLTGIEIAKAYLGCEEHRDHDRLVKFFKSHNVYLDPVQSPWCAAFVNACERAAGRHGTGKYNARSFLDYGTPMKLANAKQGDIIIFSRGNNSWEGHVAYVNELHLDEGYVSILGGNQRDKVCYENHSLDRYLGVVRPDGAV